MAPEVPFRPPRTLAVLALAWALAVLPALPNAQETGALEKNPDAVAAKARLLQELDRQIEQRRLELARQEEALAALQEATRAAERLLEEERVRLEALKGEIEADIARRETVVNERLDQIAKVYGAMKPREASLALEEMEDDMAVAILERLPGRAVGKIFDLLPKDRVRDLTRRLEEGRAGSGGE